jgi:nucleoside-diphosphate-sugar epimerase
MIIFMNKWQVNWVQGDATDTKTVERVLKDSDAAVHAIGLLFDVESGLANLNKIVSGSGSIPGESSTYDAITRSTAFNVINAIEKKQSMNIGSILSKGGSNRFPLCFVSAAEAGWPDVPFGTTVDGLAPQWLNKYLIAKRAVESRLKESNESKGTIRSAIYRPSLIWDWTKFDVLPVIPVFNLAAAIGVPFVDKTVRIETLADAIVAGIEGDDVEGVQRVGEMEAISQRVR